MKFKEQIILTIMVALGINVFVLTLRIFGLKALFAYFIIWVGIIALWKWWSKDEIDLQNIRVELVDLLHFLVSAMLCAGLSAEKLHDIYRQKHEVNVARQDSSYSQATKTEQDNRSIQ